MAGCGNSMVWMEILLSGCLVYGGMYAVYTQKKSGVRAALGMWCLCLLQLVCIGWLVVSG